MIWLQYGAQTWNAPRSIWLSGMSEAVARVRQKIHDTPGRVVTPGIERGKGIDAHQAPLDLNGDIGQRPLQAYPSPGRAARGAP